MEASSLLPFLYTALALGTKLDDITDAEESLVDSVSMELCLERSHKGIIYLAFGLIDRRVAILHYI